MAGDPVVGSVEWVRTHGSFHQQQLLEARERAWRAGYEAGLRAAQTPPNHRSSEL